MSSLLVSRSPTKNSVYLVGAGPSLSDFDFERLRQREVLAINDAITRLPFASAVVSADATWIQRRAPTLECRKLLVVPDPTTCQQEPGTTYFRKRNTRGLSDDSTIVHVSGTSGYAALNIAYLAGFITIYLLGFDYCHPKRRWYDGYEWSNTARDEDYALWSRAFESTLPQLKKNGVCVINVGHHSAITAFPKVGLECI